VIFVDTGFIFATSEDDADHARVMEVLEDYRGRPLDQRSDVWIILARRT
jgi:predicted nucleic acid-binding protein